MKYKKVLCLITCLLLLVLVLGCEQWVDEKADDVLTGVAVGDDGLSSIDKDIQRLEEELRKEAGEEDVIEGLDSIKKKDEVKVVDDSGAKKVTVTEGDLVNLSVSAEDPEGDTLKITFTKPLNSEGLWKTKIGDAGEYKVTATVSDGQNSVTQELLIIVEKKLTAPVITLDDVAAKEGDLIEVKPKVEYLGDEEVKLTYSKPLDTKGKWQTDSNSAGDYTITLTATAGEFKTEKIFKIKVEETNQAPKISGVAAELSVAEGETVTIKPQVTDTDGDKVSVQISDPVGDDGVWATSYDDAGEYTITISASDGQETTEHKVKLSITEVNRAPEIIDITLG